MNYILDGRTFTDGWEDSLKDIKLADTNITLFVDDVMPRTKEAAIDYLNEIGWLQEHDKILLSKEGSWVKSDKYNCKPDLTNQAGQLTSPDNYHN